MSRDPWGLMPEMTSTPVRPTPKTAMARADRRAALGRLAVRRGGIVGVLTGFGSFYVGDVPSCFGADQRALAYVSALPVCGVLSGLCGAACASLVVAILPRRRHRRAALGLCGLAATASLPFVRGWWSPAAAPK
ncbi:hypothetical protein pdul_cds_382 [Pandoravirus dulcis]|uniref:Uncharacterized protein n=1 Tax=Pandoravirus dulcis TaxID=1349409 RepID=S4VQ17_9VIRU|nr:hypothetical protein pdul_cds_382 [Pandoravirus dulcis]AGO82418.1 hypothetical protein pdul_cds_382 [Pandoravirus dulcis]